MSKLTPQILRSLGFQGKRIGELLKASANWSEEELNKFLVDKEIPKIKREFHPFSAFSWFLRMRDFFPFTSNSEIERLLREKAIVVNGEAIVPEAIMPNEIESLVFWPNSLRKTTFL